MSKKRTLQQLYQEIRDCEQEIESAEDTLDTEKKRRDDLENAISKLEINLVKLGKVKWVDKTFDQWYTNSDDNIFWIYSNDCEVRYGIWDGYEKLNLDDEKHFDIYQLDYFYYGHPHYIDESDPDSEMKESEMARENGCAIIHQIFRNEL